MTSSYRFGSSSLEPTDDPLHWHVDIQPRTLTHAGAVHGGTLLAIVAEALEGAFGRPVVWATAQYLHHVGPTGTIDVVITPEIEGRNTTQARAALRFGEVELVLTMAALGSRQFPHRGRRVDMPDVRGPTRAGPGSARAPRASRSSTTTRSGSRRRMIGELDGTPGDGCAALWCRGPPATAPDERGRPRARRRHGHAQPLGRVGRAAAGNSLDNTLRVIERATTEWVLLDVSVDASD